MSYLEHLLFAGKVGAFLFSRAMAFVFHAVFPMWNITSGWNLEATYQQLKLWNDETHLRKQER